MCSSSLESVTPRASLLARAAQGALYTACSVVLLFLRVIVGWTVWPRRPALHAVLQVGVDLTPPTSSPRCPSQPCGAYGSLLCEWELSTWHSSLHSLPNPLIQAGRPAPPAIRHSSVLHPLPATVTDTCAGRRPTPVHPPPCIRRATPAGADCLCHSPTVAAIARSFPARAGQLPNPLVSGGAAPGLRYPGALATSDLVRSFIALSFPRPPTSPVAPYVPSPRHPFSSPSYRLPSPLFYGGNGLVCEGRAVAKAGCSSPAHFARPSASSHRRREPLGGCHRWRH